MLIVSLTPEGINWIVKGGLFKKVVGGEGLKYRKVGD